MEHNNQAYTRIATRIKRRHHHERARTLQHHFDTYFLYVKQTEENCLIFFEKVAIKLFHKVKLVGRIRPILDKHYVPLRFNWYHIGPEYVKIIRLRLRWMYQQDGQGLTKES